MPTSFPRAYPEVRFPAEFTELYHTPLAYFGHPPSYGAGVSTGVEWPPVDGFANDNDLYHKSKALDAVRQVGQHVRNLQLQRMNQMTGQPQWQMANTADEQAFLAGQSQVHGSGRFSSSPGTGTIEGAPVLSGRGLRGGVMRTQAGRQYVSQRLTARINELNTRDAVAANQEAPEVPQKAPMENSSSVEAIGEFLDILSDNFTSGAIDSEAVQASRGLLKNLLKSGYMIPQNLITPILRQVERMMSSVEAVANSVSPAFMPSAERSKRLRTIFQVLERCRSVLDELSRSSDLSPQERQMALASLQGPLQQQVMAQEARRPRSLPQALPLARGETGYVYPYSTQGQRVRPARRN